MRQLQGLPLPLGQAPVWDGGEQRAGEEYASACGFPAAFGPLLLQRATRKVYGKVFASGVSVLPAQHTAYMFEKFWEKEVAPFDASERFFRLVTDFDCGDGVDKWEEERFFRLVTDSNRGDGVDKEQLQPFIRAIASRHGDLEMLSPDDVSAYVDTVLAVIFYRHGRCGVITLPELRRSGFVGCLNAVGRLESALEESEYFSLARHQKIRTDYFSLCRGGWSVGQDALLGYRHIHGGPAVGAFRASRVINTGMRPQRSRRDCSGAGGFTSSSIMGEYGQEMEYGTWVRFCLCEEALTSGEFTERDLEYCFRLADEDGTGKIGLHVIAPFYEDMKSEYTKNGGDVEEFGGFGSVFREYLDAVGMEKGRQYITLAEMSQSDNIDFSGKFFAQLFLGLVFQDDDSAVKDSTTPPPTVIVPTPAAAPASTASAGLLGPIFSPPATHGVTPPITAHTSIMVAAATDATAAELPGIQRKLRNGA
eukprot:jgi/Undpi1/2881/HiC_scaffold_14.g06258.m1